MRFCDNKIKKMKINGDYFFFVFGRISNNCKCFVKVWMFSMGDMLLKLVDQFLKMFLKYYLLKNI